MLPVSSLNIADICNRTSGTGVRRFKMRKISHSSFFWFVERLEKAGVTPDSERFVAEIEKALTDDKFRTAFVYNNSDANVSKLLGEDAIALVTECAEGAPPRSFLDSEVGTLAHFLNGGKFRKVWLVSECRCYREEKFSHALNSNIGMLEIEQSGKVKLLFNQ